MDNQKVERAKRSDQKKNKSKKPVNKKNKDQKKPNKPLRIFKNIIILFFFFFILGLLFAFLIFNSLKANTIEITDNNFWQNQSTVLIYDANGDEIGRLSDRVVDWANVCVEPKKDEKITSQNTLEMCPEGTVAGVSPYYINALIATEDQNFLNHNGVNFKGMFRVTAAALVNGDTSAGGGSSITMQLAKLLYLSPIKMFDEESNALSWTRGDITVSDYNIAYENSIQYKLSQMALAMKIEDKFEKYEIMENYINTMYFGYGGYGIGNAAEYYYGVEPTELTIAQAATLAGMTQRPADFNPYVNPELTLERRNVVISRMFAEGYISEEEATEAKDAYIKADLVDHSGDSSKEQARFKYFNDINLYVLNELQELLGENVDLNTGNMNIYTTIDPQLQESTVDILDTSNNLIGYSILEGTQTGTAMIDVDTGGILALGNGFDGQTAKQYSWNETHQPGSTAKPLTAYSAAIEYLGWSTAHILNDTTTYYTNGPEVNNYSRSHQGNVTLMSALAQSLNTTAVQSFKAVVDEIGIEGQTAWFKNLGLNIWQTAADSSENVYESYAIGAFDSTPLEMASAYATFANGGTYNEPHIINYIEFNDKSPYYDVYEDVWYPEYESHKAMEPSTAYLITKMLNPDVPGAFTSGADVPELDMAIKTGTSNWPSNPYGITPGAARDRWVVGYSPDVSLAVWYAYDTEHETQGYEFYSLPQQPIYIFRALMKTTVGLDNENLTDGEFEQPSNVVEKTVNGTRHYFIKDSDELKTLTTPPSAPKISVRISNNVVTISWDKVSGATSYNVVVNGKTVETTSETKAKITYDELFELSCSSKYVVGVQSVGSNGLTSGVSSYTITNDVSNCKKPEKEEKNKEEKNKEEENKEEENKEEENSDE